MRPSRGFSRVKFPQRTITCRHSHQPVPEVFSVAPMVGHTTRQFRYLFRLISQHAWLHTEMYVPVYMSSILPPLSFSTSPSRTSTPANVDIFISKMYIGNAIANLKSLLGFPLRQLPTHLVKGLWKSSFDFTPLKQLGRSRFNLGELIQFFWPKLPPLVLDSATTPST